MRCMKQLTVLLVLVFLLAVPMVQTYAAARVDQVTAQLDDTVYTDSNRVKYLFSGSIHAQGAGKVQYRWIRSDGARAPIKELVFNSAGWMSVEQSSWMLGRTAQERSLWVAIEVLYPNSITSGEVNFTVPAQNQTQTQSQVLAAKANTNDTMYFNGLSNYYPLKDNNKSGLYDTYKLWTDNGTMTVEGKVWSTTYTVRQGSTPTSDLEIIRYYSNEIATKNGSITFDGRDDAGRRDITGKFYNSSQKLVWVEVVAWNGGDDYKITWIETR